MTEYVQVSKRLLTDSVSVDFSVLLSRFSIQRLGGNITKVYSPPILESKSGQNNPKTRRNLNPLTVSKFRINCLKLIKKVHQTKRKIIITKRNKPFIQLLPIEKDSPKLFGRMKGTIRITGDIISFSDKNWNAIRQK